MKKQIVDVKNVRYFKKRLEDVKVIKAVGNNKFHVYIPRELTLRSMSRTNFGWEILTRRLFPAKYILQYKEYYTIMELTKRGYFRYIKFRPLDLRGLAWLEKLSVNLPKVPVTFNEPKKEQKQKEQKPKQKKLSAKEVLRLHTPTVRLNFDPGKKKPGR